MMQREYCPICGRDVTMMPAFQAHLHAIRSDEAHVAALYSLLGIDYAAMKAQEREELLERTRELGWEVL